MALNGIKVHCLQFVNGGGGGVSCGYLNPSLTAQG